MKNREKKAATAEKRRQRMVLILCVAILALAIVAVNVRTVVYGYYDSFVHRGVDVDTAASHLQALAQPGMLSWKSSKPNGTAGGTAAFGNR